jgi:antitoxin component YwqK of YwqJK toxin-antitoxin module
MSFPQPNLFKTLSANDYIKNVRFEGQMLNGYPHGLWQLYNSKGSVMGISRWDNGHVLKTWVFYPNGKLKMFYRSNTNNIIIHHFDKVYSALVREITYKIGLIRGTMKEFYPNGSLAACGPCEKIFNSHNICIGEYERMGLWQYYNTEGVLTHELTWKEGLVDGYCRYYNMDNEIIAEGRLIDGERVGLWRFYETEPSSTDDCQYLFTEYFGIE